MAVRIFEGENYYFTKSFNNKTDAKKYATNWRRKRWLARVLKEKDGNRVYYSVWIKRKR